MTRWISIGSMACLLLLGGCSSAGDDGGGVTDAGTSSDDETSRDAGDGPSNVRDPVDAADADDDFEVTIVPPDGSDSETEGMPEGEKIFRTPAENGNTFACETCHAVKPPAEDGYRKPGHPVWNAFRRPNYKNGQIDRMLEAVNSCRVEWMRTNPWGADDEEWKTLRNWLGRQASAAENVEALDYEIVEPPDDLSGGDPARGRTIFNDSCAGCHGVDGTKKFPNRDREAKAPGLTREMSREYVAKRIRTSGLQDSVVYDDLTGGAMPFWSKERLSNTELRHVVAFVAQDLESEPDTGLDAGPADVEGDATVGDIGDATAAAEDGETSDARDDTSPSPDATPPRDGGGGDVRPTPPDARPGPDTSTLDGGGDTASDGGGGVADAIFQVDSGCAATHRKVGWTAKLSEKFHNVGGTATIVDNCTVVIRNFTYDGNGVVVKIYGAPSGSSFKNGYSMSTNLVRPGNPYDKERLVVRLPSNKTLDDLGKISVWCVDVGVSFGDGAFSP